MADVNNLINQDNFTRAFGRAATQDEIDALNAQWNKYARISTTNRTTSSHFGSPEQVLESYKKILSQAKGYVLKTAGAMGVNLTPEQLESITRSYVNPSDFLSASFSIADGGNQQNYLDQNKDYLVGNVVRVQQESLRNPTTTPDIINQAKSIIQNTFGRPAQDDEAAYFAKELARGKSTYELAQELQSLPEYQKLQASKDREALNTQLLQQQQEVFLRSQPQIISSFLRAGRLNSSGLTSALVQAQADLDKQRQAALTQVGVNDLNTIRANAFQNYLRQDSSNQQFKDIYSPANQYNTSLGFVSSGLERQRQIEDYNRQKSDYERYLQQSQQNNGIAGAFQGALTGYLATGNPFGAVAGGVGGYYATRRN